MNIRTIQVENLRNLEHVTLKPDPRLNILLGHNGAGKTSLLEAIVVLSRGRSFRTTQISELAGRAGNAFRVFAELDSPSGEKRKIGIERSGKHWKARMNGQDVAQISTLTRALPLIIMEPESHLLVTGSPELRRKYLDWTVFHVEHDFLTTHKQYGRLLKQRNAALRRSQVDVVRSIDDLMVPLGERLNKFRKSQVETVSPLISGVIQSLSPDLPEVTITFSCGWSGDDLEESFAAGLQRDLDRGMTHEGPHRADFSLKVGKTNVKQLFSRGEQKILAAAMVLTQAVFLKRSEFQPLILLDDLASEFDRKHATAVLEYALSLGSQTWVSGTRPIDAQGEHAVFHVEHGNVSEMV